MSGEKNHGVGEQDVELVGVSRDLGSAEPDPDSDSDADGFFDPENLHPKVLLQEALQEPLSSSAKFFLMLTC